MEKKIDILSQLMKGGEWVAAIKFAAKFPRLGKQRDRILSASAAILSPDFYVSMGKNPEMLVADGVAALKERFPDHY